MFGFILCVFIARCFLLLLLNSVNLLHETAAVPRVRALETEVKSTNLCSSENFIRCTHNQTAYKAEVIHFVFYFLMSECFESDGESGSLFPWMEESSDEGLDYFVALDVAAAESSPRRSRPAGG